jgi:hypothetical protein
MVQTINLYIDDTGSRKLDHKPNYRPPPHDFFGLGGVVAEWRPAARLHAPLAGRSELVADALADDLALELGEAEQDVGRQPAHARGRTARQSLTPFPFTLAFEHPDL